MQILCFLPTALFFGKKLTVLKEYKIKNKNKFMLIDTKKSLWKRPQCSKLRKTDVESF
jgi:hypothetical protein